MNDIRDQFLSSILEMIGIFILAFFIVFATFYIHYNMFGWQCIECNVRVTFEDGYSYNVFFNKPCDSIIDINKKINTSIQNYTIEKICVKEGKDCYNWVCESEDGTRIKKLLFPTEEELYSLALKYFLDCSKLKEVKCRGYR